MFPKIFQFTKSYDDGSHTAFYKTQQKKNTALNHKYWLVHLDLKFTIN